MRGRSPKVTGFLLVRLTKVPPPELAHELTRMLANPFVHW